MRGYPRLLTMLAVVFGALFIGRGTLDVPVLVTFLLYVGHPGGAGEYGDEFYASVRRGQGGIYPVYGYAGNGAGD